MSNNSKKKCAGKISMYFIYTWNSKCKSKNYKSLWII